MIPEVEGIIVSGWRCDGTLRSSAGWSCDHRWSDEDVCVCLCVCARAVWVFLFFFSSFFVFVFFNNSSSSVQPVRTLSARNMKHEHLTWSSSAVFADMNPSVLNCGSTEVACTALVQVQRIVFFGGEYTVVHSSRRRDVVFGLWDADKPCVELLFVVLPY